MMGLQSESELGLSEGCALPEVTVVIPCLNEIGAIARVVRRAFDGLHAAALAGEVIVVDNGSTDGTAAEASRVGATVVMEHQQGYGNALRRGFTEARGQYVVMADGDDTYPIDKLGAFVELLRSGCDVVYGDRFAGGIEPAAMSWSHRYVGTPVLSWLVRKLSGVDVVDSQCGMRAFRREALERLDLRAPGMELNMEMLIKAGQAGLVVGQVPISLGCRIGESKLQTIPDGWRNLRYMLVASPDHLFLVPGVALLLMSVLILGLQTIMPAGIPIGSMIWRPQFAPLIVGSVGTQVIWFAVIATVYYANAGLIDVERRNSSLIRSFLRNFSLERMLLLSLVLLIAGVIVEILLGLQQFAVIGPHETLASIGAFSVIVGLESFFSSFITYLLSVEQTRATVRPSSVAVQNTSAIHTAPMPVVDLMSDGASPALDTA